MKIKNEICWNGREHVEDDLGVGRSITSRTGDNIEVKKEITLRMTAEELNINKYTERKIVVENHNKRKLCSGFLPHVLKEEEKDDIVVSCQNLV